MEEQCYIVDQCGYTQRETKVKAWEKSSAICLWVLWVCSPKYWPLVTVFLQRPWQISCIKCWTFVTFSWAMHSGDTPFSFLILVGHTFVSHASVSQTQKWYHLTLPGIHFVLFSCWHSWLVVGRQQLRKKTLNNSLSGKLWCTYHHNDNNNGNNNIKERCIRSLAGVP